jgi:mannose-6-phosphate isomerase class I
VKIVYASLTGYEYNWIEEALNEHFEYIKRVQTWAEFWMRLHQETLSFMAKYGSQMPGVASLRPMMTNSALTFYPQLERK